MISWHEILRSILYIYLDKTWGIQGNTSTRSTDQKPIWYQYDDIDIDQIYLIKIIASMWKTLHIYV